MKQAQQSRKPRGRSPSRKQPRGNNGNNRNEVKVRGNPKQLVEKYKTQARDAMQSGDRVQYEYFMQFADHYQRVLNDMRGPQSSDDSDNRGRRSRSERHADLNQSEGRTADADDREPGGEEGETADEAKADDRAERKPRRTRGAGRSPRRQDADKDLKPIDSGDGDGDAQSAVSEAEADRPEQADEIAETAA